MYDIPFMCFLCVGGVSSCSVRHHFHNRYTPEGAWAHDGAQTSQCLWQQFHKYVVVDIVFHFALGGLEKGLELEDYTPTIHVENGNLISDLGRARVRFRLKKNLRI